MKNYDQKFDQERANIGDTIRVTFPKNRFKIEEAPMPEARLQRTRENYRCNRKFVIVPWEHCDCRSCAYARKLHAQMRAGVPSLDADCGPAKWPEGIDWYQDRVK